MARSLRQKGFSNARDLFSILGDLDWVDVDDPIGRKFFQDPPDFLGDFFLSGKFEDDLFFSFSSDVGNERVKRSDYLRFRRNVGEDGFQLKGNFLAFFFHFSNIFVLADQFDQFSERGIGKVFALADYFFIKRSVVHFGGGRDGGFGRVERLNDCFAGESGSDSAGSTNGLHNMGKSLFVGKEIRHREKAVGGDDSDQSDVGKVPILGDHLGSDQDVNFSLGEIIIYLLLVSWFFGGGGVD